MNTEILIEIDLKAACNKEVDALLISCGELRTIEATNILEQKLSIPVVSGSIEGAWASVKLVGHSGYSNNGDYLLQTSGN